MLSEIHGPQVEKAPERGLLHRWFGKDPSTKPVGLFTGDIFDVETSHEVSNNLKSFRIER